MCIVDLFSCVSLSFALAGDKAIIQPVSPESGYVHVSEGEGGGAATLLDASGHLRFSGPCPSSSQILMATLVSVLLVSLHPGLWFPWRDLCPLASRVPQLQPGWQCLPPSPAGRPQAFPQSCLRTELSFGGVGGPVPTGPGRLHRGGAPVFLPASFYQPRPDSTRPGPLLWSK